MQELAVALIVAAALAYVGLKYMPAALRRRLAAHPRLGRWFGRKAGGCASGCDTCGSCDTPPATGGRIVRIHPHD